MSQPIVESRPEATEAPGDACEIAPREERDEAAKGRRFGLPQVVEGLDQSVLATLDGRQSLLLEQAIRTALPRSTPKLVDLRFTVPSPRGRMFFVLQMGRDHGRTPLGRLVGSFQRALNYAIGMVVILGLIYALLFGVYCLSDMLGLGLFDNWSPLDIFG